ncbi:radical SAM protein [Rhizobium ruizarguesonis]
MSAQDIDYDVVFINPPHHGEDYYSPIGIGMLHSLASQSGFRSLIIDFQREVMAGSMPWPERFFEVAEATLASARASIYGFTIMNVGLPWAIRLARRIRSLHPGSAIVFGGPHATLLGEDLLSTFSEIDIVVQNEAETIIVPLVRAILSRDASALHGVPNLLFRDQACIVRTRRQALLENLDELPFLEVDTDLLSKVEILSIEAGRGCPYHCSFCSSHAIWTRKPRFKSPGRLVSESIRYLDLAPPRVEKLILSFEHDDFLSNRPFFRQFVEEKRRRANPFQYTITARVNHISEEVAELLAGSGCVSVFMGLETGSETLQASSLKHLKLKDILPRVKSIRSRDIHVSANFILGFPDETWDDIFHTIELMFAVNKLGASINISIMCPEPGSRIYESVPSDRHVLLYEGDYAKELERGGIAVNQLTPVESFHLKTIESDVFDIREVARLADSLQLLMSDFPLSLVSLYKSVEWSVECLVGMVLQFQSAIDGRITSESAFSFFDEFRPESPHSRFVEFLLYECARSSIKNVGATAVSVGSFSPDTAEEYFKSLVALAYDAIPGSSPVCIV